MNAEEREQLVDEIVAKVYEQHSPPAIDWDRARRVGKESWERAASGIVGNLGSQTGQIASDTLREAIHLGDPDDPDEISSF